MLFVPNQNQLYALYMFLCGKLGVSKPNKEMLALLAEDDRAWELRMATEARERGVSVEDLWLIENDTDELRRKREEVVPLAFRRVFRLNPAEKNGGLCELVHLGARGALAVVAVLQELPFLEVLDMSNLTSLFLADHYQQRDGVTGNDVIEAICHMAATHPSLRVIDLTGQPIGTLAAHHLLELLRQNRRIQEIDFDRDAVDHRLVRYIDQEIGRNAAIPRSPPLLPREPTNTIKQLAIIDRKTVREQHLLRRLIKAESGLGDIMSLNEISEAVLYASIMSTTEVITRSNGLRGDGVHLFLIKSGVIRAKADPPGFNLSRGDFFGETYADVLFSQDLLEEVVRGFVYCIPLKHCRSLLNTWTQRVGTHYHLLRYSALLQPLGVWTRIRLCCCATPRLFSSSEVVISPGEGFKGFFLVTAGVFRVLGPTPKVPETCEFTVGDVFGEESLLTRKQCSSVTIVAGETTDGSSSACLVVEGCAARVMQSHLMPVFMTLVAEYSLHEDFLPITR